VSKAFEKFGVPYYIAFDSKTVLPERETLVDSLRCALNAEQDIPLYNVMSSAIGDFTRAELLEIRRGAFTAERKKSLWESLYTYKGNPKIEEKAKRFIAYLEDMRVKSSYMKASELMKMSLGTGFDAYLLSLKEDKINAVNAFIEYVGTLPQDVSCADFLEFYDNAYEGNGSPKKADAVAVMTMHASKGLEFPIVFLPYSDCCPKSGGGETLIDGELGLAVSLYADEDKTVRDTFAKTAMRLKRTDDERREQARLMYVAFTRARYKLVITGKDTAAPYCVFEGASNMQWIKFAAERDPAVGARVFTAEPPAVPPPNEARNIGEKSFDRSFAARRYAYENATKLPVKYSVSELLEKYDGFGYNPFTAKTASEAVNAGIALHEVMQRIDYGADTLAEVKDAISGMVKSGFLEQTEADAVDAGKVLALLKTDVMRRAAKSKTMREQPFIMNVRPDADAPEKALVQGVIDLVIDCGDSCEIVDFKTGSGSDETMKARYSEQLALYAEGVEKILKKPVSAKIILCAADARAIYL
jgi:ATP-dependent helicase/nuclease subunit A